MLMKISDQLGAGQSIDHSIYLRLGVTTKGEEK